MAARSSADRRPRSAAASSAPRIADIPRSSGSAPTSRTWVSKPAVAQTWAMPPPIWPQPSTPTLRTPLSAIVILLLRDLRRARAQANASTITAAPCPPPMHAEPRP